ncbi:MAG: ATP-binding cassette domain-containing protein [Vulcanimicrobiaceae bacterium]
MLEARVVKHRARFTVDVALQVVPGEACGLFGASGAGKSTVLACIAGAETPDDGYVRLDDTTLFPPPLPLHRRRIGYLTQDASLFPHLDVAQNVRFGLTNGAVDANNDWIGELREKLQIAPIWHAPAHAISGGQARRVALARMLARKPMLVLLDEPFSGLDRHLVRELIAMLAKWHAELRFALLVVDHDAEVLERICPRTIAIEDGRIVQSGSWDALRRQPATPLLAQLLSPL